MAESENELLLVNLVKFGNKMQVDMLYTIERHDSSRSGEENLQECISGEME